MSIRRRVPHQPALLTFTRHTRDILFMIDDVKAYLVAEFLSDQDPSTCQLLHNLAADR